MGRIDNVRGKLGGLVSFATGPLAAAMAGVGAGATIAGMVSIAAQVEQTTAQFKTLLGSADDAKRMLEDLQSFAASTPFQFDTLAGAAKSLLAFGVAGDQVVSTMKILGDISAATGNDVGELASIYGKVRSQGQLTTDALNQLGERGIPVGKALAEMFGRTEAQIREMTSSGQIGFSDLQLAMQKMTSEGGDAFNGMADQAGTLTGVWSTLKDNVSLFMGDIGKAIIEGFDMKDATTSITGFVGRVREEWMPGIVGTFQTARQMIVAPFMDAFGEIGAGMFDLVGSFDLYWQLAYTKIGSVMLDSYQVVSTFFQNSIAMAGWFYNNIGQVFSNIYNNIGKLFGNAVELVKNGWDSIVNYFKTGKIDFDFSPLVDGLFTVLKDVEMPEIKSPELGGMQQDIDRINDAIAQRQADRDEARRKRLEDMNKTQEVAAFEIEKTAEVKEDTKPKDDGVIDEADEVEKSENKKIAKVKERAKIEAKADQEKQQREGKMVSLGDLADQMQMAALKKPPGEQGGRDGRGVNIGAGGPAAAGANIRPMDNVQANAGGGMGGMNERAMVAAFDRSAVARAVQGLTSLMGEKGIKLATQGGVDVPGAITQFGPRGN